MIDQSHNTKPKLEAMVQTVEVIQTAQAKALLVDRKKLKERRERCDVAGAERCMTEAYNTDRRAAAEVGTGRTRRGAGTG